MLLLNRSLSQPMYVLQCKLELWQLAMAMAIKNIVTCPVGSVAHAIWLCTPYLAFTECLLPLPCAVQDDLNTIMLEQVSGRGGVPGFLSAHPLPLQQRCLGFTCQLLHATFAYQAVITATTRIAPHVSHAPIA